jgi:hypothetical protein
MTVSVFVLPFFLFGGGLPPWREPAIPAVVVSVRW